MPDNNLLLAFRNQGVLTARELANALGISQPTISRLIARAGTQRIIRIAGGRSTRYGLRRNVRDLGSAWPLYEIDADGKVAHVGDLYALANGVWHLFQSTPWATIRAGEFPYGIYPGLPWFLQDLRPRGFLGRCFARRFGPELGCSPDPRSWHDDDVLAALVHFGNDLPGNFVVGDRMLRAVQTAITQSNATHAAASTHCERWYPELADATLAGQWPGSSAAGEQPKFTACIRDADGAARHVIVKFSGRRDRPENQRWADLLVAEALANEILSDAGVPCASTRVLEAEGRCFLESTRFDRVGAHGRRGLVSLESLDAAHFGAIDTPWTDAAHRLQAEGWITEGDAHRLALLWWFGTLIGNTDMHYGNASLFLNETRPLELAPTYDMVPMQYRPDIEGRLTSTPLMPLPPPPQARPVWQHAAELAAAFWRHLAHCEHVSPEFRSLSRLNSEAVAGCLAATS